MFEKEEEVRLLLTRQNTTDESRIYQIEGREDKPSRYQAVLGKLLCKSN